MKISITIINHAFFMSSFSPFHTILSYRLSVVPDSSIIIGPLDVFTDTGEHLLGCAHLTTIKHLSFQKEYIQIVRVYFIFNLTPNLTSSVTRFSSFVPSQFATFWGYYQTYSFINVITIGTVVMEMIIKANANKILAVHYPHICLLLCVVIT